MDSQLDERIYCTDVPLIGKWMVTKGVTNRSV
jgi:hypothetical protein